MRLRSHQYGIPAILVATLVAVSPFLFGLPRGTGVPVLRPSEAVQLLVTGGATLIAMVMATRGRRWRLVPTAVDGWLLAMAAAASIVPILWLAARGGSIGGDEILAVFPFVKYAALFVLVRLSVRTADEVRLVVGAALSAAAGIAVIAVAQALGVGPVVDLIGRFFVSSTEDVVDGGRATTTIGSSIATGAYLSIATGVALAAAFTTGRRRWYPVVGLLALGALASGQAGTAIGLVVIVAAVAVLSGRGRQVALCSIPAGALATIGLWPIVAARLADVDQASGLPESWLIRWNNLASLYWPDLRAGGWLLGVSPDATVTPPDVWREIVYLESGYLWLLWVGGVPLLVAAVGFLASAWFATSVDRTAGPVEVAIGHGARAAVVMVTLLTVIDPHLTLRAGADLFYVLIALALARTSPVVAEAMTPLRWRSLLGSVGPVPAAARARLHLAEGQADSYSSDRAPETVLDLSVVADGRTVSSGQLILHRVGVDLHGQLAPGRVEGTKRTAAEVTVSPEGWEQVLLGRAAVLCADSLRLSSLRLPVDPNPVSGSELKRLAHLVETTEIERHTRASISDRAASVGKPAETAAGVDDRDSDAPRPAVRLTTGHDIPAWKRAVDLAIVSVASLPVLPLAFGCGWLVRRSGPGPVLFRQVRIGTGGLPFQIYKFRTMHVGNDDRAAREQNRKELLEGAEAAKDETDGRITPIGRWLRRLSLDELPQLLNIVRGEMSLVGPRPSLLWETELFEPSRRRRLVARPGLTGPWQVGGRADVSMAEMLEIDLDYVESMSLAEDLRCLAGTASSVLAARGAR